MQNISKTEVVSLVGLILGVIGMVAVGWGDVFGFAPIGQQINQGLYVVTSAICTILGGGTLGKIVTRNKGAK
jgi:hypothetical protein